MRPRHAHTAALGERKPRELTSGGHGGGPHEVVGARSSAAARGEARAPMSRRWADAQGKMNRRRRVEEERKGGGVRRGRRGGDRSAPGTGAYIPGRFTPGASHQPGVKVLYSRLRVTYSQLVTRTGSKGFFLAGHETATHLYSRVGFPPGSKGGLQFRFPRVLSKFF